MRGHVAGESGLRRVIRRVCVNSRRRRRRVRAAASDDEQASAPGRSDAYEPRQYVSIPRTRLCHAIEIRPRKGAATAVREQLQQEQRRSGCGARSAARSSWRLPPVWPTGCSATVDFTASIVTARYPAAQHVAGPITLPRVAAHGRPTQRGLAELRHLHRAAAQRACRARARARCNLDHVPPGPVRRGRSSACRPWPRTTTCCSARIPACRLRSWSAPGTTSSNSRAPTIRDCRGSFGSSRTIRRPRQSLAPLPRRHDSDGRRELVERRGPGRWPGRQDGADPRSPAEPPTAVPDARGSVVVMIVTIVIAFLLIGLLLLPLRRPRVARFRSVDALRAHGKHRQQPFRDRSPRTTGTPASRPRESGARIRSRRRGSDIHTEAYVHQRS